MTRLRANGTPDPTFPVVLTDVDTNSLDRVFDLAIQADGRIVVVGSRISGGLMRIAVLRYASTGVLDNTFSSDGRSSSASAAPRSRRRRSRSDPTAGSWSARTSSRPPAMPIVRLTTTGALDTTFSGDGGNLHARRQR